MLKRGDHGPSVAALRERLRLGGELGVAMWRDAELFDEALEQALKRFQQRHGLTANGTVDTVTRTELNMSAESRVEQLELNLERWRWLPQDLGQRHIIVNIAAFELEVEEEGKWCCPCGSWSDSLSPHTGVQRHDPVHRVKSLLECAP